MRSYTSYTFIGLIILLITGYSVYESSFDEAKHALGTFTLNSMRQYDKLLDENLIKVNSSIIFSYDKVVEMVDSIEATELRLQADELLLIKGQNSNIQNQFDKIVDLHEKKFAEIENFKMNYSVFRNSLHALPKLSEELDSKLIDSGIKLNFGSLVNYTLGYNNSPDKTQKLALLHMIDSLSKKNVHVHDKDVKRGIHLFLYHAKNVLNLRQKNSEILDVILSYETDSSISVLNDLYNDLYKEKDSNNKRFILLLIIAATLLFVFIIFILLKLDKKGKELKILNVNLDNQVKDRTLELSIRNKQITDSINYAKRIQEAIIPKLVDIRKDLPKTDWIYKSKDVVSGDFPYYFKKDHLIYYAAVDCTGHGVPGAMMSLIGHLILNHILNQEVIYSPSEVLTKLHNGVVRTLKQDDPNNTSADGMDIGICCYNTKTKTLEYSGAHRPLYLLRSNKEIIQYKGGKYPIGGNQYSGKNEYPNHQVDLLPNDTVYFFSDGYPDQFGGEDGRKFGPKRIRQLLENNADKTVIENINMLNNTFDDWKGDQKQIDDVLLIGIKF